MLKYHKMSLFDAPKGSILVHACNAEGIWGSGIAAEMKERYPLQYEAYKANAHNLGFPSLDANGTEDHHICNLITSSLDSKSPDSEELILINTTTALLVFIYEYRNLQVTDPIYSNKFNSGIFGVPWERTELILKTLTDRYGIEWNVCEYEPSN